MLHIAHFANLDMYIYTSSPKAILEGHGRLPSEFLQDELVVAVPAAHPFRARDVLHGQVLALDVLDQVHHIVHGQHFCAAQVQGLTVVRFSDAEDALDTIINEREAASLLSITPHLNLIDGRQHLGIKSDRK